MTMFKTRIVAEKSRVYAKRWCAFIEVEGYRFKVVHDSAETRKDAEDLANQALLGILQTYFRPARERAIWSSDKRAVFLCDDTGYVILHPHRDRNTGACLCGDGSLSDVIAAAKAHAAAYTVEDGFTAPTTERT